MISVGYVPPLAAIVFSSYNANLSIIMKIHDRLSPEVKSIAQL
jgi:hypothetical protein